MNRTKFNIAVFIGIVITVATLNFLIFFHEYVVEQRSANSTTISSESP